jgi:hypothetical protein
MKEAVGFGVFSTFAAMAFLALAATQCEARGAGGGLGTGLGGQSSAHISAQGSLNTNGPNAKDRDFGQDRAADRRGAHISATGSANTNGLDASDRDTGSARAEDRKKH